MSKKHTDAKMSKGKFALNVALIVLQVVIVVVAIAFSISILLSTGYESNTDFGKSSIRLMPVLTDSMAGDKDDSFKAGDLIIVKSAEKADLSSLKEGDIITYLDYVGGDLQFVTHRIIDVSETSLEDGTVVREFTTRGDAEDPATAIPKTLYQGDIKGIYVGKLAGVGSAVFWLQDPTHFFLVIMLPLILLLLYNAYLVVRIIIDAKLRKQREQLVGATAQGVAPIDEEEIKRRAIEEYLKSHGGEVAGIAASADEGSANAETTKEKAEEQPVAEEVKTEEEVSEDVETEEKTSEIAENGQSASAPTENAKGPKEETVASAQGTEAENTDTVSSKEDVAAVAAETDAKETDTKTEAEETKETEEKDESVQPEEKSVKKPAAKKTTAKKPAAKTSSDGTVKKTSKTASKTAQSKTGSKKPAAEKATSVKKPEAKTGAAKTATAKKTSAGKTSAEKTDK